MYNKKMGKLYVNGKGDMKSGGKASGKGVSAALVWLPVGALLLALAILPLPVLAATPITTCTELQNIDHDLTGDYYLANDISCSGFDYGDGKGFMPIGASGSQFTGTFDGRGYKITSLDINRPSMDDVGLFGWAGSGSEIKDVSLEGVDVSGGSGIGGLVGYNWGGTITNCSISLGSVSGGSGVGGLVGYNNEGAITNSSSSGTVSGSGDYVGGLIGDNYGGTITNSSSSGSVSGDWYVGGLVGRIEQSGGTIENSYSSSTVSGSLRVGGLVGSNYYGGTITNCSSSGSVSGDDYVGGLVGYNYPGTIINSSSSGTVSGTDDYVGGLVGYFEGTITNSSSSCRVSGTDYVGGLVGDNYGGTITNSYSSGYVRGSGNDVGGLVGLNNNGGTITNSYSSGNVRGYSYFVGGLVGHNGGTITNSHYPGDDITCTGCDNTIGNTTKAKLQNGTWLKTAPNNWDFDTIWGRVDGVTYPYLQWEFADVNCTCGDVCVNETGWQRDRSPFIASNAPIQNSIDNTSEGNTICVEDGTYTENVDVTRRLTVRSENGSASTTVQAQSTSDHVFYVTADYVNVFGFTMTGATGSRKAGIYLSSGMDNCTIFNNSASNNYAGIYLNNADNNNISCNWVHHNNEKGFYLTSGSTGNIIGNNNIMSNGASANDSWHYNFYNDQENAVTATANYWGTDNETLIAESIYDWNEDSSKGNVTFGQRSGPAPCAPIPELATVALFSVGLLVLAGYVVLRRRI
jgi:parallel beta-helix repeat protein